MTAESEGERGLDPYQCANCGAIAFVLNPDPPLDCDNCGSQPLVSPQYAVRSAKSPTSSTATSSERSLLNRLTPIPIGVVALILASFSGIPLAESEFLTTPEAAEAAGTVFVLNFDGAFWLAAGLLGASILLLMAAIEVARASQRGESA